MKLERWEEAEKLFESGYRKANASSNQYQMLSLRGWADASLKLDKHDQALRLYRKYAEESSKVDWKNPFRTRPDGKR